MLVMLGTTEVRRKILQDKLCQGSFKATSDEDI